MYYGVQVPCVYRFTRLQSCIKMLRNLLDLANNLSVRDVHKRDENLKRVKQQQGRCMK